MSTLLLEDLPSELVEGIQRLAQAHGRTVAGEAVHLLERAVQESNGDRTAPREAQRGERDSRPGPLLPDPPILDEAIPAPFDLPLPEGVPIRPTPISKLLPEPHDLDEGAA